MNSNSIACFFALSVFFSSCKKYLDAKPDSKLVVPRTITDLQSLMDNSNNMNNQVAWSGEGSADNYFLPDIFYNSLVLYQRDAYIWGRNSIPDELNNDWSTTYLPVYYSNIVLEGIVPIQRDLHNGPDWDNVKGTALLFRAKYFLDAVLLWSKIYSKGTANDDPGIPLRLHSDFNEGSVRASVQVCYDRIISDLKEAVTLLPRTPFHLQRPSIPAAYALLSRTYMAMQEYDSAGMYANKCLQIKGDLLDYNTLDLSAEFPIERFNKEVIMQFTMSSYVYWLGYYTEPLFYASFDRDDLRKSVFFRPNGDGTYMSFTGSYNPDYVNFAGLAVDEMLLTRAECFARAGKTKESLNDLNKLLVARWKKEFYVPVTAGNSLEALKIILKERRKELMLRGTRWLDLKRLNVEPEFAATLKRYVNGTEYVLPPNDNRYLLPIPNNIIATSGMQQNPR